MQLEIHDLVSAADGMKAKAERSWNALDCRLLEVYSVLCWVCVGFFLPVQKTHGLKSSNRT